MKTYLSIKPGETKVIKKSAKVSSVINYGNVTYTSTCGALPSATAAQSYQLSFGSSADQGGGPPALRDSDDYFRSIEILGQIYMANILLLPVGQIPEQERIKAFLLTLPQSVFKYLSYEIDQRTHQKDYYYYFQSIPEVAATIKVRMEGLGFRYGLYILPVAWNGISNL